MSVGHIYHYFESKDAIVEAIVDKDIEEAPGTLDDFSGADRVEAIAAIFQGLIVCERPTIPIWTATHSSAPRTSSCGNS